MGIVLCRDTDINYIIGGTIPKKTFMNLQCKVSLHTPMWLAHVCEIGKSATWLAS